MATNVLAIEQDELAPTVRGAEYALFGRAPRGGPYNSHVLSAVVFLALAGLGLISAWLTAWIMACLIAALCLDARSWKRKVVLEAIPAQSMLYAQVLAQAIRDAFPWYVFAYLVYVCVAPLWEWANLAISSFAMLYAFYMTIRAWWLVKYLWLLTFRWGDAGATFAVQEANLKSRGAAIRHVLWAYFLGNIGIVVRCASQLLTISLFEWVRTATAMDLRDYPSLNAHLLPIGITVGVIWLATFWLAVRRTLLIYYRTHRTFHNCLPLYDSIHSIHHRGVLPTPLDSGTISPAEFIITEMGLPAGMLVPNWWWTGVQIGLGLWGHWPSHDAGTKMNFSQHHLHHHRLFNVNFGLTQSEDEQFGTLYTESEEAPATATAPA